MTATTLNFDPGNAEFVDNPYPTYQRLRNEQPLYFSEQHGLWFVSRHADVSAVFADHSSFSSSRGNVVRDLEMRVGKTIGSIDPPEHDALRTILLRGFTPQRLELATASLRADARARLAEFRERREWDFAADFSRPVLFAALGRMLGFDAETAVTAANLLGEVFDGEDGPLGLVMQPARMAAIFQLLKLELAKRQASRSDDLFSVMLAQRDAGAELTDEQIIWNMSIVLLAGNASIGHFVPNLILALYQWPDQRRLLLADPQLIDAAIEEGVRYDTSTVAFGRQTTRDVELAGGVVPKNQRVIVLTGAANRDERAIDTPEAFDLRRRKVRHFGFGAGAHACMGAATTRRFLRALLEELLPVVGEYQLDVARARRVVHVMARGFQTLPMRW